MSKLKVAVLASGGGTNLQALIDGAKDESFGVDLVAVIVNRKNAYARERAEIAQIPNYYFGKGNCDSNEEVSKKMIQVLQSHQVDLVVLAGYLNILSPEFVQTFDRRIINIHPSLMPKYCGMHFHGEKVHKAVLEAKEKETGATVHFVDSGVDTGEIIAQVTVSVFEEDTVKQLQERVLKQEHILLCSVVQSIAKGEIKIG